MRISDWSPDVGSSDLAYVKQIDGGIGYVELSYALQNKLTFTRLKNAAGKLVQPRDEPFSDAAASADWANAKDFYLVMNHGDRKRVVQGKRVSESVAFGVGRYF